MKSSLLILFFFLASQFVAWCLMALGIKLLALPAGQVHPTLYGASLLVSQLLLVVELVALKLVRRRPFAGPGPRWRGAVVAAPLAVVVAGVGLSLLFSPLNLPDGGTMALFSAMKADPLCLLMLCLVGPVVEELTFREGIQRQLVASGLTPVLSAAVAAGLFAVVHANMAQALPAFAVGMAIGLLYARTGNLRLSAAAHVANNTLAVALLYFPELEGSLVAAGLGPLLTVGGVALVAGVALLAYCWPRLLPSLTPKAQP